MQKMKYLSSHPIHQTKPNDKRFPLPIHEYNDPILSLISFYALPYAFLS